MEIDYVEETKKLMKTTLEINKRKHTKTGILHSISRFMCIFWLSRLILLEVFFFGFKYVLFIYDEMTWNFLIIIWFISFMSYFYTRRLLKLEKNLKND